MVKNYKIGDELICLQDIRYGGSVIFIEGKSYTISHVGHVYYVIDGVSFQRNLEGMGFFEFFGTSQEYRKLKLEKLKIYGRDKNIQSVLQKRFQ